jgi:hypothetical protein
MPSPRRPSSFSGLALLLLCLLQIHAASNECGVDCGPYGKCIFDDRSCGNNCTWNCQCVPGWDGKDCSIQYDRCDDTITGSPDDATECFHGGTCESYVIGDGLDSKGIRCNCQAAVGDAAVFAGLQCEYEAQEICEQGKNWSSYAFCVNGGTCKKIVPPGQPHPLCNCVHGFAGRHCQFAANATPIGELIYVQVQSLSTGGGLSGAGTFFIVVLVLGSLAICVGCCMRKYRRSANAKKRAKETTGDLDLELTDSTAMVDAGAPKDTDGMARDDNVEENERAIT